MDSLVKIKPPLFNLPGTASTLRPKLGMAKLCITSLEDTNKRIEA